MSQTKNDIEKKEDKCTHWDTDRETKIKCNWKMSPFFSIYKNKAGVSYLLSFMTGPWPLLVLVYCVCVLCLSRFSNKNPNCKPKGWSECTAIAN